MVIEFNYSYKTLIYFHGNLEIYGFAKYTAGEVFQCEFALIFMC